MHSQRKLKFMVTQNLNYNLSFSIKISNVLYKSANLSNYTQDGSTDVYCGLGFVQIWFKQCKFSNMIGTIVIYADAVEF